MSLANGRCDQCGAATNTAGVCYQCENRKWSIKAAPPADEEAVRLLEETLRPGAYGIGSTLASRIDAYLAKAKK